MSSRTAAATRQKYGRAKHVEYVVAACIAQAGVAFMTAIMGLGWGGSTYTVATSQTLWAFVPILLLAVRPPWPLAVPLLSGILTVVLVVIGGRVGHTGA